MDSYAKYIGLVYSVFGYDPVMVKFINSLASVFTAILLFLLIKEIFSVKTANIALVLGLFWPSILLWSATGLKDTLTSFWVTLGVFAFCKIKKHLNLLQFLLVLIILATTNYKVNILLFIIMSVVIIIDTKFIHRKAGSINILAPLILVLVMKLSLESLRLIRLHIFIPLLLALLLSAISFFNRKQLAFLFSIFFCLLLFAPFYLSKHHINVHRHFQDFTKNSISSQRSQLYAADTGYKVYPDRFYRIEDRDYLNTFDLTPLESIISYIKGLAYALFAPFPWLINNKMTFFASFQMAIYYILSPFVVLGLLIATRYKWRYVLPVLIFIFLIVSMYALFEGNIGTVFRHRDLITTFLLSFSAIGISKFLGYTTIREI